MLSNLYATKCQISHWILLLIFSAVLVPTFAGFSGAFIELAARGSSDSGGLIGGPVRSFAGFKSRRISVLFFASSLGLTLTFGVAAAEKQREKQRDRSQTRFIHASFYAWLRGSQRPIAACCVRNCTPQFAVIFRSGRLPNEPTEY